MATGVLCTAVQLSQPFPTCLPAQRVSLPNPIPSKHVPRRTVKESHGGFRWHRPAFQPFQLKPWVRDLDVEEELRQSLVVMGPGSKVAGLGRGQPRSLTAPPIKVSSMAARRGGDKLAPTTAGSRSSFRDLLTKRGGGGGGGGGATFPARPPLSKGKQIPGRFFPKPSLTAGQRSPGELNRCSMPRKAFSLHSATPSQDVDALESSTPVSRVERPHSLSSNQLVPAKIRQQLQKERPEVRSEVFAICFKQEPGSTNYDPNSELHSDYYSIKRLQVPAARLGAPRQQGKIENFTTNNDDFAVVLRGHRKHLHSKLLSADSVESLIESVVQPARGTGPRKSLHDDKESLRKVIDIQTPKAGEQSDDQSDMSDNLQDADNTLAPLNSPTDQKDVFPALV